MSNEAGVFTPNLPADTTTQNTPAQGTTQPPFDLHAMLADDLRSDPMLAPFKTINDLAKSYKETKSLVGADTIRRPSKHATEKDRIDFMRKAFDVPQEFEKYDVKLPKGVTDKDEFFLEMKKTAFELGLPQHEFSKFANKFYDYNETKIAEMQLALDNKNKEEWAALQKRYGQAFPQKMAIAENVLKEFAGADFEAVKAEMISKGWGSSPWLSELMVRIGEFRYNEDQIKGMSKLNKLALDPKEAQAEIENMKTDEALLNKLHPNHAKALARYTELHKMLYTEDDNKSLR